MNWNDINKVPAPLDKDLLVYQYGEIIVAYCYQDQDEVRWRCSRWCYLMSEVTHWMELPNPPMDNIEPVKDGETYSEW